MSRRNVKIVRPGLVLPVPTDIMTMSDDEHRVVRNRAELGRHSGPYIRKTSRSRSCPLRRRINIDKDALFLGLLNHCDVAERSRSFTAVPVELRYRQSYTLCSKPPFPTIL